MSWCDSSARPARRALWLAPIALLLAGCGFHPLYRPNGSGNWDSALAAINVQPIANRSGQILELALREDLNPGALSVPKRWILSTALIVSRADLGIQRNATATTSEITVTANFTIRDAKTGKPIYSNSSQAVGDFDLINDAYATEVAAQAARDRAIREVADEMTLRLALFVRAQRRKAVAAQ